jgi:hypothetical protein
MKISEDMPCSATRNIPRQHSEDVHLLQIPSYKSTTIYFNNLSDNEIELLTTARDLQYG